VRSLVASFCSAHTPSFCPKASWVPRASWGGCGPRSPTCEKSRLGLSLEYTDTKLSSHSRVVSDARHAVLDVPEHGAAQVDVVLHQPHARVARPALLVVVPHLTGATHQGPAQATCQRRHDDKVVRLPQSACSKHLHCVQTTESTPFAVEDEHALMYTQTNKSRRRHLGRRISMLSRPVIQ